MNINLDKPSLHELTHFGVIGMHWGVRKQGTPVNKEAAKDAQRHMDAKMAYGEGAGTRRKLLKAEIKPKLKDPFYAKSFDDALSQIDTTKSASRARAWRGHQDAKSQAVRSTKQIAKYITGTTSLAAIGLAYMRYKPQVDSFVRKVAKNSKPFVTNLVRKVVTKGKPKLNIIVNKFT